MKMGIFWVMRIIGSFILYLFQAVKHFIGDRNDKPTTFDDIYKQRVSLGISRTLVGLIVLIIIGLIIDRYY